MYVVYRKDGKMLTDYLVLESMLKLIYTEYISEAYIFSKTEITDIKAKWGTHFEGHTACPLG